MADSASAIVHGGGLIAARRQFPGAPEPWIDLSTGINAVPYPVPPLSAAAFHRLPEPEDVQRLEAAAARAYGVADPSMVVAVPGTQILISLLPRLLRLDRVAIVGPTYAEHAAAWAAGGSDVRVVPNIACIGAEPGAVLCNPNNPDGRRTRDIELVRLAQRLAWLVVDEAFADLEEPEPGLSIAPMLPANAIVLRSFGKTYGLAGLRLGFGIAAPEVARMIRSALGPWAISGAAIEIGTAALADRGWLAAAQVRLARDAARLDHLLTEAGMQVIGGTRLFRLASMPNGHAAIRPSSKKVAASMHQRLGQAGILVRRFDAEPSWLRFGIPAIGWDRVQAALTRPDR
jgi:cobalamin biosynthetic protein CobC